MRKLIFILLIFLLFPYYSYAYEYFIKQTDDFKVTGLGDNLNWGNAEWLYLKSKNSNLETKAKLMYSQKGIYILFNNQDRKITATKVDDYSDLWNEDVVEMFLQPVLDLPLYFEYEISPLNKELFLLVPNHQNKFQGWQLWRENSLQNNIQHQVEILDSKRWIVEIFIPYEVLKPLVNEPPKKGEIWKGNLYRIDYDDHPIYWFWNEVGGSFHQPEKFGVMIFD